MEGLQEKIERIRTWQRDHERAVHKPLLLLLALSRVLHGYPRLTLFEEIEGPLRDLLKRFGRPRSSVHPEYPFWRLQNDGLWEVRADIEVSDLVRRENQTDPKVTELRKHRARGGFTEDIFLHLVRFPRQTMSLVEDLLMKNFAGIDHDNLRAVLELSTSISELSHLQEVELAELAARAEQSATSTRLNNAIAVALRNKRLVVRTVADYLQKPNPEIDFLRLPNVGKKCVVLLRDLVAEYLEDDANRRNVDPYDSQALQVSDSEETSNAEFLQDDVDDLNQVANLTADIWTVVERVTNEAAFRVLQMRLQEGKTLEETGRIIGVTRERVRQIQKREVKKLRGRFRDELEATASRIDILLDQQHGITSHATFCASIGCSREAMPLLLALVTAYLKETTKQDEKSMVYRKSSEGNWPEWTASILETVYSAPWPISLEYLVRNSEGIPSAFVGHVLRERLGATLANGKVTKLARLSETHKFILCLRSLGRQSHVDEIAHVYEELFDAKTLPRNAGAVLQRLSEALIVDRGVYCLYEHLWFNEGEVAAIANECVDYLKKKDHYVSTAVVCDDLFKDRYTKDKMNKYVLLGILQDDDRFITRRGFMVALSSKAEHLDFRSLEQAIYETVRDDGPLTLSGIREALRSRRHLLDVTIKMTIDKDPRIVKVAGALFDLSERLFEEQAHRVEVEDAIRICLLDGPRTLFAIVSMLETNDALKCSNISPELVSSLATHMADIEKLGDRLSLPEPNPALLEYKALTAYTADIAADSGASDENDALDSPNMIRFAALDCRDRQESAKAHSQPESIRAILGSFGEL